MQYVGTTIMLSIICW